MHITQFDPADRKLTKKFIELPFGIYRNIPQWVPPLGMDLRQMLNKHKHPFYRHGDAAFFLAHDDAGTPVGRLAVLNNRDWNEFNQSKTAFFYLFECIDDRATGLALFEAGELWAQTQDLNYIIGPKGFTVFDGLGMLVKGFEHRPAFGLPYNPPYYPKIVEAAGFVGERELLSGYLDKSVSFPPRFHEIAQLLMKRRGLHVARFQRRSDLQAIIPKLKELYNASLGGTSGNVPLTDDDVKGLADQMMWFADPKLIKIVMKGDQPVGFLFAYPDISETVQRIKGKLFPFGWLQLFRALRTTRWVNINGAGMAEGYRGLGGTALLFDEMFKSLADAEQFEFADLVQIGTENDKMQRELRDLGVDFYKKHRIYEKAI